MAIRIRKSGGMTIALCAAETDAAEGDIYLDDAAHGALSAKFEEDFISMGFMPEATRQRDEWAEMEKHKLRDAKEELNKWLAEQATQKEPLA